jgi:hypothetical protein
MRQPVSVRAMEACSLCCAMNAASARAARAVEIGRAKARWAHAHRARPSAAVGIGDGEDRVVEGAEVDRGRVVCHDISSSASASHLDRRRRISPGCGMLAFLDPEIHALARDAAMAADDAARRAAERDAEEQENARATEMEDAA